MKKKMKKKMTDKTLTFELAKYHKKDTKSNWKRQGMKFNDNFEYIYEQYIYCRNCDLCNKEFKSSQDRQLDHNHETGEIRNIVCKSCNQKRKDKKIRTDNTSNHKLISKDYNKKYKKGFIWIFKVQIDGKQKTIKRSINIDFLIKFRDNWIKENNYYT